MSAAVPRSSLALRTVALFEGLDDAALDQLAQACRWVRVEARQPLLLRAGQDGDVFFLVSGAVRVAIYAANGRQVTFRDHGPGEMFGDLAAIDGGPRSADVFATEPCVAAVLDRAGFLALLREQPLVAERLLRRLAALVRELSGRVIELSTLPVGDRLRGELLRLAHETADGPDTATNTARLSPAPKHAVLASRIGTNREQVSRELAVLQREGLVAKDGADLLVADLAGLVRSVASARGEAA